MIVHTEPADGAYRSVVAHRGELCDAESEAVLGGPLAGLKHRRSAFDGIPQLLVELEEPGLGLRRRVREMVTGCHVGFMMTKPLCSNLTA